MGLYTDSNVAQVNIRQISWLITYQIKSPVSTPEIYLKKDYNSTLLLTAAPVF
jgi:hypothetical protein